MKTMRFLAIATVIMVFACSTAFAGGNKKTVVVPATEFVVIDSIDVEYNGQSEFSFDQFRKENKFMFSPWDRKINDENFGTSIQPGQKVTVYIAEEKNGKIFTTTEAETYIANQNAETPSIAWLMLAQAQYGSRVWQQANTVCFSNQTVAHKSGSQLIPFMTKDGGVALFAREYPCNNGDVVDQFAFIKK